MSKVCQLSGKRPQVGRNISHSNRKTLRRFMPNLVTKRILDPITGEFVKVKMSVQAQRTLLKNPQKFAAELKKLVKAKALRQKNNQAKIVKK